MTSHVHKLYWPVFKHLNFKSQYSTVDIKMRCHGGGGEGEPESNEVEITRVEEEKLESSLLK